MAPGGKIAVHQGGAMTFQPIEEGQIADEAVFHHLGIAGEQLAPRQGGERVQIGQHEARLMEAADEVLALRRVDSGLAADGAVHLGQQGGRDLDEVDAAQKDAGREARQIADDPAAQRDQQALALDPLGEQAAGELGQMSEILGLLARRQRIALAAMPAPFQARLQQRQVVPADTLVGDDEDARLGQQGAADAAGLGDQPRSDQDIVAARAEFDPQSTVAIHC